jgi:hypothetical protein
MGCLTSTTVATKVEVYGISGGKLYNKSYDKSPGNGRWSQWTAVPGGAAGLRSVTAATSGGVAHLALVGSDNAVYTTGANYSTGTWSPVTRLDGTGLTALTSTVTGTTLHLYGLGNGRPLTKDLNTTTGTGWLAVPGGASGVTALTASAMGTTVHLELAGSDGALHNTDANYSTGTWSPVTRLDGTGLTALTSTVTGTTLHLYGITNGMIAVKEANYTTGTWSPWTPVPGSAAGAKAITSSTN